MELMNTTKNNDKTIVIMTNFTKLKLVFNLKMMKIVGVVEFGVLI